MSDKKFDLDQFDFSQYQPGDVVILSYENYEQDELSMIRAARTAAYRAGLDCVLEDDFMRREYRIVFKAPPEIDPTTLNTGQQTTMNKTKVAIIAWAILSFGFGLSASAIKLSIIGEFPLVEFTRNAALVFGGWFVVYGGILLSLKAFGKD